MYLEQPVVELKFTIHGAIRGRAVSTGKLQTGRWMWIRMSMFLMVERKFAQELELLSIS